MEEALVEMYLAGVSVRRVEDITEALWGTRVSPSTVSELNQKIYAQDRDVAQPADRREPPVCVSRWFVAKAQLGGEVRNVSLLVAIGVNEAGFREVLAMAGVEGRQGELDSISAAPERTRPTRGAAVCF